MKRNLAAAISDLHFTPSFGERAGGSGGFQFAKAHASGFFLVMWRPAFFLPAISKRQTCLGLFAGPLKGESHGSDSADHAAGQGCHGVSIHIPHSYESDLLEDCVMIHQTSSNSMFFQT